MKILCPISGELWECPQFRAHLIGNKSKAIVLINHPIFSIDFKALLNIYSRGFERGTLNHQETRLLALALFNSSQLVIWESPAIADFDFGIATQAIVALIPVLETMNETFQHSPAIRALFAKVRVSNLNNDMAIMLQMAQEWTLNYKEYIGGYQIQSKITAKNQELESLERSLSREYKSPNKHIKNLARYIIDSMPSDDTRLNQLLTFSKGQILSRDYYKYIIEYSGNVANGAYKYPITAKDINDLQDLIIDHLDYGDIFCFRVTSLLDKMLKHGAYNRYGINMMASDIELSLASDKEELFKSNNPEPIRCNFAGYNAFFIAKNDWLVAMNEYINNNN